MDVWLNGTWLPRDTAAMSVFDAGLQHGVGLFETMHARNGRVFRVRDHLERLRRSATELRLTESLRIDPLIEVIESAVERNGLRDARVRLIVTDGIFSMDGYIAKLQAICDLAERYDALVMVDDSHATGFMGATGRGTHEACGVMGRVDIITGTFGKALGGASGGFTAARQPIADLLRQRSRPYLFSNSLAPAICAATLKTLDLLEASTQLRDRVHENARYFRAGMEQLGFELLPGEHPIVPVMLHDAHKAQEMAARMLNHGVYVIAFSYPVVPEGRARIRTQISAAHSREDLDQAVAAFKAVKREMNL